MSDQPERVVRAWHRARIREEATSALNLARLAVAGLEALTALAASDGGDDVALRNAFDRVDGPMAGAVSALGNVDMHLKVMPGEGGEQVH